MSAVKTPDRRFIVALYELAGDYAKKTAPFGEIAQQAGLSDQEAHGAFATLRQRELITSDRTGCVSLTDAGRKAARGRADRV